MRVVCRVGDREVNAGFTSNETEPAVMTAALSRGGGGSGGGDGEGTEGVVFGGKPIPPSSSLDSALCGSIEERSGNAKGTPWACVRG